MQHFMELEIYNKDFVGSESQKENNKGNKMQNLTMDSFSWIFLLPNTNYSG